MPTSHLHSLPTAPKLSRFGRALAAVQVLKETLSIVFLGWPLVTELAREAPLILLSALPGVVLYLLHWQLALGRVGRMFAAVVWGLTLLDELWGWLLFRELEAPTHAQIRMLHWSYFLGLGIMLLALGELGWRWQRRRAKAMRNVHHKAVLAGRQRH
ncbi:hypothetical protein [Hymenobacter daeguensis]